MEAGELLAGVPRAVDLRRKRLSVEKKEEGEGGRYIYPLPLVPVGGFNRD
jgi:hypothetical protein